MEEELFDFEFAKQQMENAKNPVANLQGYKLCYVSNASFQQIKLAFGKVRSSARIREASIKDNSLIKTLRHDGCTYTFIFIKDDLGEDGEISEEIYDSLAYYNTMFAHNIIFARKTGEVQRKEKGYVDMVNRTFFVDAEGEFKPLNYIPIATIVVKDDEVSQNIFREQFMHAKKSCENYGRLMRKKVSVDDNEGYCIYLEAKEDLYAMSKDQSIEGANSFKKFITEIINNIELDLEQTRNSCVVYKLMTKDGRKQDLNRDNQAYIGESNRSSYCVIGDASFDTKLMCSDYQYGCKKFGNAYPIDLLMFLPDGKTLDVLKDSHQQYVNLYYDSEKTRDQKIAIINHLNTDIARKTSGKLITENGKQPFVVFGENYFDNKNFDDKAVIDVYSKKLEVYKYLKNIQSHMDYKDKDNTKYELPSVLDLGYSLSDRQYIVEEFGKLGADIYDRYYCMAFTKKLMEGCQISGTLIDLTYLSNKFRPKEYELRSIERLAKSADSRMQLLELAQNATIDDYISIIQRFDGVVDLEYDSQIKGRDVDRLRIKETSSTFDKEVRDEIMMKANDIITPWISKDGSKSDFKSVGYSVNVHRFNENIRAKGLNEILNKANTLAKTNIRLKQKDTPIDPEVV